MSEVIFRYGWRCTVCHMRADAMWDGDEEKARKCVEKLNLTVSSHYYVLTQTVTSDVIDDDAEEVA